METFDTTKFEFAQASLLQSVNKQIQILSAQKPRTCPEIYLGVFDRLKIKTLPLKERESKSSIEKIAVNPDSLLPDMKSRESIKKIASAIIKARKNNCPVVIAFGAHLIKNGLSLVLRRMIEEGFVTHLATNGAGSIHDWEFAFQGKTEEDVEKYVKVGQFGIWEETGKYINLALILGAINKEGYGESIGRLISNEELVIPMDMKDKELQEKLRKARAEGRIEVKHLFKRYSVQESAFFHKIPFTVHPGFGYDIIYTHHLSHGESIGKTAEIDFLRYVESISKLEGGVYISIGSAIMSPMVFEKSLSMARNVLHQEQKKIEDFMIVINDIKGTDWDFGFGQEPPKTNPAYYERFCKTFKRMGAREIYYINEDNKNFLLGLYNCLKNG